MRCRKRAKPSIGALQSVAKSVAMRCEECKERWTNVAETLQSVAESVAETLRSVAKSVARYCVKSRNSCVALLEVAKSIA